MPSDLGVYQPPKASVESAGAGEAKLYTAGQVGLATFLGTPLAGCLLLAANYGVLGRGSARRQAIVWGVLSAVALLVLSMHLPEKFPNSVIPIGYTAGIYQFAKVSEGEAHKARFAAGGRQSNWKVVGIGLGCLVGFVAVLFVYVLALG